VDDRYDENGEKRLSMMSDLKKAVDNEELTLIYQPRVPLGDNGEHYVEALVRWQHPTRGSCRRRNSVRSRSRPASSARSRTGCSTTRSRSARSGAAAGCR
jgi:predicted signal transduction protein with EAL and GGDEF domain